MNQQLGSRASELPRNLFRPLKKAFGVPSPEGLHYRDHQPDPIAIESSGPMVNPVATHTPVGTGSNGRSIPFGRCILIPASAPAADDISGSSLPETVDRADCSYKTRKALPICIASLGSCVPRFSQQFSRRLPPPSPMSTSAKPRHTTRSAHCAEHCCTLATSAGFASRFCGTRDTVAGVHTQRWRWWPGHPPGPCRRLAGGRGHGITCQPRMSESLNSRIMAEPPIVVGRQRQGGFEQRQGGAGHESAYAVWYGPAPWMPPPQWKKSWKSSAVASSCRTPVSAAIPRYLGGPSSFSQQLATVIVYVCVCVCACVCVSGRMHVCACVCV